MVRLNRIYTKTGDDGTTSLGNGVRLPKHHLRIESYGTVDELSSVLGLAIVHGLPDPWQQRLLNIQNDLFDVGSDLCVPGDAGEKLRLTTVYSERIEAYIDELNEHLDPLASFVLPGGSKAAAWLHLARTVCRRAERLVVQLAADQGEVNPEVIRYLNRLSDFLFVMARTVNDGGKADVLWEPGSGSRSANGSHG